MFDLPKTDMDDISFFEDRGLLPVKSICEIGDGMKFYVRDETI